MQSQGETFWLIGGSSGWLGRTAQTDPRIVAAAVSDREGVRLAARAGGPLALSSADNSLGGLILPQGMAFDVGNTLYLLSAEESYIKRFAPDSRTFQLLPEVGGVGSDPRQFDKPSNIAIVGPRLYVADTGNRRVQVFDLDSLALLEILNPVGARTDWNPSDVAEHDGDIYILDSHHARIYRHTHGDHLMLLLERADRADQWTRIAIDQAAASICSTQPTRPSLYWNPQTEKTKRFKMPERCVTSLHRHRSGSTSAGVSVCHLHWRAPVDGANPKSRPYPKSSLRSAPPSTR